MHTEGWDLRSASFRFGCGFAALSRPVRSAFTYPLRGSGPMLLFCGTIFFGMLEVAVTVLRNFKFLGMLGAAFWLTVIMGTGYLYAFLQNIITSTANGEESMPSFPEISSFMEDLLVPAIRFLFIFAACAAPGIALMIFISPLAGLPILLLGVFCLPMAFLTVAMADSIGGLNPLLIIASIAKVPLQYLLTCLILLGVLAVSLTLEFSLSLVTFPIVAILVSMPISLYGLTVGMRVLGSLYYVNRTKLAWFD